MKLLSQDPREHRSTNMTDVELAGRAGSKPKAWGSPQTAATMVTMPWAIHRVGPSDWRLLRELRLGALSEAPYAFGSTFSTEAAYPDERWAELTEQLTWFVVTDADKTAELIAALPPEGE